MLKELSVCCVILMNLICVFGIIGNALSLYVYSRPAFRKRSINVLLLALSASDFFVVVLAIPVFSSSQIQELMSGCQKVIGNVMLYFYPVTIMFQSYCTRSRALLTVACIVIFSFTYNVCRFWEYEITDCDAAQNRTRVEDILSQVLRADETYLLWYQMVATLLSQFVLPLAVLCILNLQVARTILAAGEQRRQLVARERREHSTAKMMLFVVIVFIVCYTFSFILNVAEAVEPAIFRGELGFLLNDFNNTLIVINSSSSFIFYVNYSTRYRAQLRQICCADYVLGRFFGYKSRHHRTGSIEFSTISTKASVCTNYYGPKRSVVHVNDCSPLQPSYAQLHSKRVSRISFG